MGLGFMGCRLWAVGVSGFRTWGNYGSGRFDLQMKALCGLRRAKPRLISVICSLNSIRGGYIGDYIADCYWAY